MQVVRFAVCDRHVGFPVDNVREVVAAVHIAAVFRTPPFVVGLMNVRGEAVPVLDLSRLFDFHRAESAHDRVVIAEHGALVAGFLAHRPVDIVELPEGTDPLPIEGAPALAALERVVSIEGQTVLVLAPERLFDVPEMVALRSDVDLIGR